MTEDDTAPVARRRRRDPEWTYATLIDALLELVSETGLEPTLRAVAERAGVSERTVFVHFADREALYAAGARRQAERWLAPAEPVDPALPPEGRVEALLAQRERMYELMTPVRTLGLGLELRSPGLRTVVAEGDAWFRADTAAAFAPELAAEADPDGLLDALDTAVSWAAWNHLRVRTGRDAPAARRALARALTALLAVR